MILMYWLFTESKCAFTQKAAEETASPAAMFCLPHARQLERRELFFPIYGRQAAAQHLVRGDGVTEEA